MDNEKSYSVTGHPFSIQEVTRDENIYRFLGSHQWPGYFVSGLEGKGMENLA